MTRQRMPFRFLTNQNPSTANIATTVQLQGEPLAFAVEPTAGFEGSSDLEIPDFLGRSGAPSSFASSTKADPKVPPTILSARVRFARATSQGGVGTPSGAVIDREQGFRRFWLAATADRNNGVWLEIARVPIPAPQFFFPEPVDFDTVFPRLNSLNVTAVGSLFGVWPPFNPATFGLPAQTFPVSSPDTRVSWNVTITNTNAYEALRVRPVEYDAGLITRYTIGYIVDGTPEVAAVYDDLWGFSDDITLEFSINPFALYRGRLSRAVAVMIDRPLPQEIVRSFGISNPFLATPRVVHLSADIPGDAVDSDEWPFNGRTTIVENFPTTVINNVPALDVLLQSSGSGQLQLRQSIAGGYTPLVPALFPPPDPPATPFPVGLNGVTPVCLSAGTSLGKPNQVAAYGGGNFAGFLPDTAAESFHASKDGPTWHEQALVPFGTNAAVDQALHQIQFTLPEVIFAPGLTDGEAGSPVEANAGRSVYNFFIVSSWIYRRAIGGKPITLIPFCNGRRLLPGQYYSGLLSGDVPNQSFLFRGDLGLSDAFDPTSIVPIENTFSIGNVVFEIFATTYRTCQRQTVTLGNQASWAASNIDNAMEWGVLQDSFDYWRASSRSAPYATILDAYIALQIRVQVEWSIGWRHYITEGVSPITGQPVDTNQREMRGQALIRVPATSCQALANGSTVVGEFGGDRFGPANFQDDPTGFDNTFNLPKYDLPISLGVIT